MSFDTVKAGTAYSETSLLEYRYLKGHVQSGLQCAARNTTFDFYILTIPA